MTDQKTDQPKDTGKTAEKPAHNDASLTHEDLDKVSGGLNPQPLPPSPHDPHERQ